MGTMHPWRRMIIINIILKFVAKLKSHVLSDIAINLQWKRAKNGYSSDLTDVNAKMITKKYNQEAHVQTHAYGRK